MKISLKILRFIRIWKYWWNFCDRDIFFRVLYADDSALLHSGTDPKLIADFLLSQLSICHSWLIDNRLSLHLGKTECILFGPKRRLSRVTDFAVKLGDAEVKRVTSVRYLGVLLDQHLNFSTHVEKLLSKARSRLAFLYRNRGFLKIRTRKLSCQSLILSCLKYCSSSWYRGLPMGFRDLLNVFQRKCVRFVLDYSPRSHIGNAEYGSISWLSFPKRVSYFNLIHIYKVKAGLSPFYLADGSTNISNVHRYNLRQCKINFSLARCPFQNGTFQRTAIKEWNALPVDLKEIRSLANFESRLKCYLQSAWCSFYPKQLLFNLLMSSYFNFFYTDLNGNKSTDFLEYSLVIWLCIVTFCYLNTLHYITPFGWTFFGFLNKARTQEKRYSVISAIVINEAPRKSPKWPQISDTHS